jgi:tetratricopeptide (TPR) repeat protein
MIQKNSIAVRNRSLKQMKDLRKRLIEHPNNGSALYELGRTMLSMNEVGPAISALCQAVATDGKSSAFYAALGRALHRGGRQLEAICAFRQALALDPDAANAYDGLGLALKSGGDLELAAAAMRVAVKKAPNIAEYWANLAVTLNDRREYSSAYRAARRAYALNGHSTTASLCICESLLGLGRMISAMKWLRGGLRRDSKWANGYHNIGRALQAKRKFTAAKYYYRKTISFDPDHADAHFGLATCSLAEGNFAEGWGEYEWRFKLHSYPGSAVGRFVAELTEPMWNGEDLSGKTLLVYTEQGYGDSFQSLRYVAEVVKMGCRVILMVYKDLLHLLKPMPCASVVVAYGQLIPRYDFHIAMFSLPGMLKTTVDTIPCKVPYIPSPSPRRLPAILRKPAVLRVGFVWSTRPLGALDNRSIPIVCLEPLFRTRSIAFYSLQVNDDVIKLDPYTEKYPSVHNLKPFIKDWQDTAYFISKMNVILSIDSGVAHLSGALGVPVWLMLSRTAEWRWLSGESGSPWVDKSPWYPTMRIFRSRSFGSWDGVIESIRIALLEWTGGLSRTTVKRQIRHSSGLDSKSNLNRRASPPDKSSSEHPISDVNGEIVANDECVERFARTM